MTKSEKWLPIPRYEGFYEVSDWGRVRSLERKITYKDGRVYTVKSKHLKTTPNVNGYPTVALCRNNVGIKHEVHRLVLTAFIGEREEGKQGCHNDGNPLNNNLSNLRWDTVSENRKDCVRHGRNQFSNRTHCPRGHALEIPNLRPADLKKWMSLMFSMCESFTTHTESGTLPPPVKGAWRQILRVNYQE